MNQLVTGHNSSHSGLRYDGQPVEADRGRHAQYRRIHDHTSRQELLVGGTLLTCAPDVPPGLARPVHQTADQHSILVTHH